MLTIQSTNITAKMSTRGPDTSLGEGDAIVIGLSGNASQRNLRAAMYLLAGMLESAIGDHFPAAGWTVHSAVDGLLVQLELGPDRHQDLSAAKTITEMAVQAWRQGFWGAQRLHAEFAPSWRT